MSKLICTAYFWNEIEWIDAQIKHILYWEPDKIVVCEGCWDTKFPARSTDGTREKLEEWCAKTGAKLIDNIREHDYRKNQCETANKAMDMAGAKPGDWLLKADGDLFVHKNNIQEYREWMKKDKFDHPEYTMYEFFRKPDECYKYVHRTANFLPYKMFKGAKFIPTNNIGIDGKYYCYHKKIRHKKIEFPVFHYCGINAKERMKVKYAVGDRKSPMEWKDGLRTKQAKKFTGKHPLFAVEVLEEFALENTRG